MCKKFSKNGTMYDMQYIVKIQIERVSNSSYFEKNIM